MCIATPSIPIIFQVSRKTLMSYIRLAILKILCFWVIRLILQLAVLHVTKLENTRMNMKRPGLYLSVVKEAKVVGAIRAMYTQTSWRNLQMEASD